MYMTSETNGKGGGSTPKTFVVANQKGGVGKTVTSMGLAQFLSKIGKVLAIDLDPQGHLTMALGGDKYTQKGAYEALTKKVNVGDTIQVLSETLHVLPGTINLSNFEREQIDAGLSFRLLKFVIEPLNSTIGYDYIVIDTPPALGLLNTLALTACKNGGIIIPAFPESFSEDGIKELWQTILTAKEYTNSDLKVLGILLTNHNPQTTIGKIYTESYQELANMMGTTLFNTYIRRSIKLTEAASTATDIMEYQKEAPNLIEDYINFVSELLDRTKETENIEKGVANNG